jgi:hypothetical protein
MRDWLHVSLPLRERSVSWQHDMEQSRWFVIGVGPQGPLRGRLVRCHMEFVVTLKAHGFLLVSPVRQSKGDANSTALSQC